MNNKSYFFILVLSFLSYSNSFAQNCTATSGPSFESCAATQSSGKITIRNNSMFTVGSPVDIRNIEVAMGNSDIVFDPGTQVDAGTIFSGNGAASMSVSGVVFTKNTSPTFAELNAKLASGTYTTLGAAVAAASPLPVTLVKFKANFEANEINLTWQTASEIDNEKFEIYKSTNGYDWELLGEVVGSGTSVENNNYQFTDKSPSKGQNYFRLKQIDFDGEYEFSESISIEFGNNKGDFSIFPNPASDVLNFKMDEEFDFESVEIFDGVGRLVFESSEEDMSEINVSDLPKGIYLIVINSGRNRFSEKLLIE